MKNNKFIHDIDLCKVDVDVQCIAHRLVKKLSDLDINMTALNRLYLKASNNYYSS